MTAPFIPLDPRGTVLGDEVYARLGEAILEGHLAPGERLRDHELAERLGVSRTPVREALQRLERTGLVEVAPNRYTRVTTPNPKAQADVFEFVGYLMGVAVRMAVARCSDDALADTLHDADAMIEASRADDHESLARSSHAFFARLTLATENLAMLRVMREGEIAIRRSLPGWQPFIECPIGRTAAYEAFRDAVAERDAERAESLLRDIHGFS
ncbi:GntR family transcriptional regulator [Microbacterium deminutum]|uniref:HTH gntR-type domain-containing protein n=1 Tax=Microbacterium deminutum TaxID=344164 RepID=A0ABP5C1S8_9MICO